METQLLAIFGHYDSRGGTTAIRLDAATKEAVKDACLKYDEQVFFIDAALAAEDWWTEEHRPSFQDFLFVAELHHTSEFGLPDGDLVSDGSDVLINESSDLDEASSGTLDFENRITASLASPVQLELITFEESADADLDVARDVVEEISTTLYEVLAGGWKQDRSPEQQAHADRLGKMEDDIDALRDARKAARAQFISNAKTRRWDDDAFGFMIHE